jgi:hypothetical protein
MLGASVQIPGFLAYAAEVLKIPCQLFDPATLLDNNIIKIKQHVSLTPPCVLSLSAALPTETMERFNIYSAAQEAGGTRLFVKQIVTASVLFIFIFGTLFTHLYLQRRALSQEMIASEKEVVDMLKTRFPQMEASQIVRVMEDAQDELTKEENTWFAFSSRSRASMLKILLELKTKIDKDALGFVINTLTITEGFLTIKASVKNHDALKLLEQALRTSALFKYVEPQADPTFEMKITLAPSSGKGG